MNDFQKANQCLVAKKYEQAIQLFLKHAKNTPGEAAMAYAGAAECCLRSNTIATPVSVARGVSLVSAGDRETAETYFRLSLQADSSNAKSLWGLSQLIPDSSPERQQLLERLVNLQPNTLNLVSLGDYYRTCQKDLDRAYSAYKRALEHSPRDQTAYLRLNDICRRMNRAEEAKEWSNRWQEVKSKKRRVDGK